jgi:hypothetical protein
MPSPLPGVVRILTNWRFSIRHTLPLLSFRPNAAEIAIAKE